MGGGSRPFGVILLPFLFLGLLSAFAGTAIEPSIELTPDSGTVGDLFALTLTVDPPEGVSSAPEPLPEALGPFHVLRGEWKKETGEGRPPVWTWRGAVAAYETGDLELPPIQVVFPGDSEGEPVRGATRAVPVTIRSVLEDGSGENGSTDLSDLKPPATIAPDYSVLLLALVGLGGLLAAGLAIHLLQKRYADRLAAVAPPADPFHRMPPHEWAYQALQELLKGGNAVPDRAGPFFEELARIVKLYFSGRFRVDLLECVTPEVPDALRQAGVDPETAGKAESLLDLCDQVKFARWIPEESDFRKAVENAYALVDATRPAEDREEGRE